MNGSPIARSYFVLHRTETGEEIVGEHATAEKAQAHYRQLISRGWPETRSAVVYAADSLKQLEDDLAKRVQLVCFGVGAGYWESPEGQEQLRLQDEQEDRDCLEDVA